VFLRVLFFSLFLKLGCLLSFACQTELISPRDIGARWRPGYCNLNVAEVLNVSYFEQWYNDDHLRVLIVLPTNGAMFRDWSFHVLLARGRSVFDYDYRGKFLEQDIESYFAEELASSRVDKLLVFSLSKQEYLRSNLSIALKAWDARASLRVMREDFKATPLLDLLSELKSL